MQKQYDASCITPLGQLFFFRMFLLYSTGIKYLRSDIAYLYRSVLWIQIDWIWIRIQDNYKNKLSPKEIYFGQFSLWIVN